MRKHFVSIAATAATAALASCGGPQANRPDRASWVEHMHAADCHERAADQLDQQAHNDAVPAPTLDEQFQCGDTVLNDQLTTGGLRVTSWMPCWNAEEEVAQHRRFVAEQEREAARRDRHAAAQLAETEASACATIPEREREHSAFAHAKEIAAVMPLYAAGGEPRGVKVVFAPVRGLHADWIRADIACQRARWATFGQDPKLVPHDPTLVAGAHIAVAEVQDHVEVTVTTDTPDQATIAIARAQGSVGPQTATR